MPTMIAQISDFHITPPGVLAYGRVDTARALARAVAAINALPVQPDVVIGTGDLTQGGDDLEYDVLLALLGDLKRPFMPLLGNHDRRDAFRRAFPDIDALLGRAEFIQYVRDVGELRIIALDTVNAGAEGPSFCAERAAWLDEALAVKRPTVIAMHHPPFPCGVDWLEPVDPHWSAPIAKAVEAAPHVVRVLCGHVHRGVHRLWRGVPASTAPSTAHQVYLDLRPKAPAALALEAPGFQLHDWIDGGFTTYAAAVDGLADRFEPSRSPSIP